MAPRRYELGLPDADDTGKTIDELSHQNEYRAPELAAQFGMPLSTIEHEALTGRLKSFTVEHHVVCIRRENAIAWLARRG